MNKLKRISITLLLLLQFAQGFPIEDPVFRNYSIEEGLYHSYVYAITQDQFGFMWVGTSEGLHRFDGRSFKYFSKQEGENSLLSNQIYSLYADSVRNLLWIGCRQGILTIYDIEKGNFSNYQLKVDVAQEENIITSIIPYDKNQYIVSMSRPARLFIFNITDKSFREIDFSILKSDDNDPFYINQAYIDAQKKVWLATDIGLLKSFTSIDDYRIKSLTSEIKEVKSIISLDDNRLIITTVDYVYLYNVIDETKEIIKVPPPKTEFDKSILDKKGNIWYTELRNGLYNYNLIDETSQTFKYDPFQKNSLPNNNVITLYFSHRDSILWIGTEAGLSYLSISSKSFKHIIPRDESFTPIDNNFGMLFTSDGSKWISGTNALFYSKNSGNKFQHITSNHNIFGALAKLRVHHIAEDNNKTVWFATSNGLFSYKLGTKNINRYKVNSDQEYSKQYNHITKIFFKEDKLWLSTYAGISCFDKNSLSFKVFPPPKGRYPDSTHMQLRDIVVDFNGNVWIGENLNGVYRYNISQNQYIHYTNDKNDPNSLSSNSFISFCLDSYGNIWISNYFSGISKYDDSSDTFINYSVKDGLSSNSAYSMIEDKNHNLWISTNKGISRLNPKQEKFTNYGFFDGLYVYEFNQGSSFKTRQGEIYFGGVGGIVHFYPENIMIHHKKPKVYISEIYLQNHVIKPNSEILNNKSILVRDELNLKYKKSTISFDVTILDYLFPNKTIFSWMLENYEDSWNHSRNNQTLISYTNLPPGTYRLLVRSGYLEEEWSDPRVELEITITPPWWRSTWFKTISLMLILASIILIFQFRVIYLKRQRKHLNNLVNEKTEELHTLNESLEESNAEFNAQNEELQKYKDYLEEIVNERTIKLKEALTKAEESDRLKTAILTNMSHEIRTPLNAISGYSSILDAENFNLPEKKGFIQTIQKNVKNLLSMIDNIIELSKLESGISKIRTETISVNNLIEKILEELKDDKSPDVTIIKDLPKDNTFSIEFDKPKLELVLYNLLSNAVKFTNQGSISIGYDTYSKEEIANNFNIQCKSESDKYMLFYIKDTGIGISPNEQSEIFNVFKKIDHTMDKLYRGIGIGLTISRRILNLVGGKIWLDSQEKSGSTFYFIIPLVLHPEPGKKLNLQINYDRIKKKNILLVEDEEEVAKLFSHYLKDCEANIFAATNGMEALEILNQSKIDIILMDIRLPKLNGFDAMSRIKQIESFKDIPVIATTAYEFKEMREKFVAAGFVDFLQKPVLQSNLISTIIKHLK